MRLAMYLQPGDNFHHSNTAGQTKLRKEVVLTHDDTL